MFTIFPLHLVHDVNDDKESREPVLAIGVLAIVSIEGLFKLIVMLDQFLFSNFLKVFIRLVNAIEQGSIPGRVNEGLGES